MKKIIYKPHIPTKADATSEAWCVSSSSHSTHIEEPLSHLDTWGRKTKQNFSKRFSFLKTSLREHTSQNSREQRGPAGAEFRRGAAWGRVAAALPASPQSSRGPGLGSCQCSQKWELRPPASVPHHTPTLKTLAACFNGEREWPVQQDRTRPMAGCCLSRQVKRLERPLLWNSSFNVDQCQIWTSQQHLRLYIILLTLDTNLWLIFKICSHYTQHKNLPTLQSSLSCLPFIFFQQPPHYQSNLVWLFWEAFIWS